MNWGVFLVLGIFAVSFIAAKASREFRFRMPDVKTGITSFWRGTLMGFGAALAGGRSIGNGLVMTAIVCKRQKACQDGLQKQGIRSGILNNWLKQNRTITVQKK